MDETNWSNEELSDYNDSDLENPYETTTKGKECVAAQRKELVEKTVGGVRGRKASADLGGEKKDALPNCLAHLVKVESQSTPTFQFFAANLKQQPKFAQDVANVVAFDGMHYAKKGARGDWLAIVRGMDLTIKHKVKHINFFCFLLKC